MQNKLVSRAGFWRKTAAVGFLLAVLFCVISWNLGSQLIRPVPRTVPLPNDFTAELVSIPAPLHQVAAWWSDRGPGTPVVLLLHPVRSNRASMVSRAKLLTAAGCSVLLIDLQGHGETPGDRITFGSRESEDVQAALRWIRSRSPERKIGVIGWSLGGAAFLLCPQPQKVDAVVLEAVYPRLHRALENRIRMRAGPIAPLLTPFVTAQISLRLHLRLLDLEPIRSIGRLHAPILIAAGSDDLHTTLDESRELYAVASSPKVLWILRGARHVDLLAYDPEGYSRNVIPFLIKYLRTASY